MQFRLDDAKAILTRTPGVLKAMLQGLPKDWVSRNEGEETWSPFDVLGHLIHGERTDWIPRAKMILEAGESQTFEPFDRFAQFEASEGKTLDELLDTFVMLRERSIVMLNQMELTSEDMKRAGRHPALGRVTLGELIATWAAHDLDHIVQISRTMAHQYGEAVGPWRAFLSVLNDGPVS